MIIEWVGANPNNFQSGRGGKKINKIVIHWIVGKLAAADAAFQNPKRPVSAHYGVGPSQIHQYVKDEDTAYHAGNFQVNQESIGIEHEGGPDLPISESVYHNSAELLAYLSEVHDVPLNRNHIWGHREIKATQCPGTLDIDKLIALARNLLVPPIITPPQGGTDVNLFNKNDDEAWKQAVGITASKSPNVVSVKEVEEARGSALTPWDWIRQVLDKQYAATAKENYDKGIIDGKAQVPTSGPTGSPTTQEEADTPSGQDTTIPPVLDPPGGSSGPDNRGLLKRFLAWLLGRR